MRNVLNKTRPKDKKEVSEDLKEIFDNFTKHDTIESALEKKDNFLKK
jgi:transposase-like protein